MSASNLIARAARAVWAWLFWRYLCVTCAAWVGSECLYCDRCGPNRIPGYRS